ncbi:cytidine deaminase [Raineya orbicola]|jgi:cytidine deaminase|uniref:Cytidine deaminase n=1 Tax=Raineya orbicola TaxID=2016530 RepID=A0A2N3IID3_9BACT|nr:cytidine deaminase [Raineya orbicola]PKQ70085.1 Cytidine deaminase [Raineya orbicola]
MSKTREFSFRYEVYENEAELSEIERILLAKAKAINEKAYAPYSNFWVSACLYLTNGEFVEGINQENAAYPSGLCAERVALFRAGVQFPDVQIEKIMIMARFKEAVWQYVSPCGACRQVMMEFEEKQGKNIEVLLYTGTSIIKIFAVKDLLPFHFEKEILLKNS